MFDLHDPKNLKHVRNIFFQRFFYQTTRMGIDPEDMLQDIYAVLWSRNRPGTEFTPFDPSRGGKSTYLVQVCRSILSHKRKHHNSPAFGAGAEHLPLQIEDEQSGEIQDLILLPPMDAGDGGSAWERAAEAVELPVQTLRECADGRDLVAEQRKEEREERMRAAEGAAAARAALAALSPEARAERDRALSREYFRAYRKRKKEAAQKATPSQD